MDLHYPTIDSPATPEYVLSVLRDMHRQQREFDPEADPDAILSMDTSVAQWREACDLLGWRQLGRAYNDLWSISCSDAEWREVLEPARDRRLRDVCQFIAARTVQPAIRPWLAFGRPCAAAGAFLTIRSILHQTGGTLNDVSPSTSLDSYTRKHLDAFLGPISRLAPGALPSVRIEMPGYDRAVWCLVAAMLGIIVGMVSGFYVLTIACLLLVLPTYLLTEIMAGQKPASVTFGELRTFRDIAYVVANDAQRPSGTAG